MAPIIHMNEVAASSTPTSTPSSAIKGEIIVNIFFELFAVAFGFLTLWQGHRLWRSFRQDTQGDQDQASGTLTTRVFFLLHSTDTTPLAEIELPNTSPMSLFVHIVDIFS